MLLVSAHIGDSGIRTNLDVFHAPASVAVVGASANPAKWGYWLATGALAGRARRAVYLVNRSGATVHDVECFTSLADLPETPELVAIAVPGPQVPAVLAEALERGSRAFLVVAAHLDAVDEVRELLDRYDARMIGPNSLGIYSAADELQLMWGGMPAGSLAIISQSGQLGSEIAALGKRVGVGISRFVSLGSQLDVRAADVLRAAGADPNTKTVGLYIEDFSGATALFAAIRDVAAAGKPVILITTGDSDASRQLAQSHTGAMTSPSELVDAACRASGALRVRTPAELVHIAAYLDCQMPPAGPRVAVISDSGGQGGIAADEAARLGLELPELSSELQSRIAELLKTGGSTRNPIDLAGAGEANLDIYAELPRILGESGEVDAVVLSGYFCSYGEGTPSLFEAEKFVAARLAGVKRVPTVVHAMAPYSELAVELHTNGVMVVGRIEDALKSLAGARRLAQGSSALPVGADGQIAGSDQIRIREQLVDRGLTFPEMRVVRDAEEAARAATELNDTVVLKAAWLTHKTEFGGVALGLVGPTAVRKAFTKMHAMLGDGEYTIERQDAREHVVEFMVSARRDPSFGPVVTVGYGGTDTEVWGDIALEMAPVDVDTAAAMIARLRSSRLLGPWRGRPALAAHALAETVSTLSSVLVASTTIAEIELNPVRVGEHEALAVDCLAVLVQGAVAETDR